MRIIAAFIFFLYLSLNSLAAQATPDIDDLNLIQKEVQKRLNSGPISDEEKQELERILEYVNINILFKEGDDAIRAKYPGAVILETEKTKVKFFLVQNHDKQEQILAIQGSVNLINWIIDFLFWKVKDTWLDIKLHKGFYMASREIFWKVVFHLNPEYSTTVTGHSLGGSCAVILGMYLDNFGHKDVKIMSLGQPRVTNKKGTKPFAHIPFTRVAIKRDIVTRLPPRWLWYRHFGKKFELRKANFGWSDDQEEEDSQEALDLWEEWTKDHDETETPTLEAPYAAKVWMELRPEAAPATMSSLFQSDEWKQLSHLVSENNERKSATTRDMEIVVDSPVLDPSSAGGIGDWFRYHNLEEYHKRTLQMIEDFTTPPSDGSGEDNSGETTSVPPVFYDDPAEGRNDPPIVDTKRHSKFYLPFLVQ